MVRYASGIRGIIPNGLRARTPLLRTKIQRIRIGWPVSRQSLPHNQRENKHVESFLVVCLDPGSTPGISTSFYRGSAPNPLHRSQPIPDLLLFAGFRHSSKSAASARPLMRPGLEFQQVRALRYTADAVFLLLGLCPKLRLFPDLLLFARRILCIFIGNKNNIIVVFVSYKK